MVKTSSNNKKLLWGFNIFNFRHKKRRSYIGRVILTTGRSNGRRRLFEGTVMAYRSKRQGLLKSSLVIRRKIFGTFFYVDFPLFYLNSLNFQVVKFSYGRRINCSKLMGRFVN
jgi:hypothetical protein